MNKSARTRAASPLTRRKRGRTMEVCDRRGSLCGCMMMVDGSHHQKWEHLVLPADLASARQRFSRVYDTLSGQIWAASGWYRTYLADAQHTILALPYTCSNSLSKSLEHGHAQSHIRKSKFLGRRQRHRHLKYEVLHHHATGRHWFLNYFEDGVTLKSVHYV